MSAEEYLLQPQKMERELESIRANIELLRSALTNMSIGISDMPHAPSPVVDKISEFTAKVVDLEREIEHKEIELAVLKSDIMTLILQVEDVNCRNLLFKRYIEQKSWDTIADEIFYNKHYLHRLNSKAVSYFSGLANFK